MILYILGMQKRNVDIIHVLVLKNNIVIPPTFQIKLSSLVVKPVSNFVANNPPNCSIVHVSGSVTREEYSL